MNQVNLSLAPAPAAYPLEAVGLAASRVEAGGQTLPRDTVLQVPDQVLYGRLQVPLRLPSPVVAAMQQLVDLVKQLRSPAQGWAAPQPLTPEVLAPYATEEIEEVLQALTEFDVTAFYGAIATAPVPTVMADAQGPVAETGDTTAAIAPTPILVETLVPLVLWHLARTAYPVMQLLEGVAVAAQVAESAQPSPGVLRLVAILQLETLAAQWAVDLVTGDCPHHLLDRSVVIHLDPTTPLASYLEAEGRSEPSSAAPSPWADCQLQRLTEALLAVSPTLQPWLTGVAVRCLIPGQSWQLATLRLRLDFELLPQVGPGYAGGGTPMGTPVEAELMDEPLLPVGEAAWPGLGDRPDLPQIAVFEVAPQPQIATTMVRLAAQPTVDALVHLAVHHEIEQGLGHLCRDSAGGALPDAQLILNEAYRIAALPSNTASLNWSLLQPELVFEELIPKLLWQATRSSYGLMSWLGGVDGAVLQPEMGWATGTLRFVVILAIALGTEPPMEAWAIDLATGRFLPSTGWQVAPEAMVRCPGVRQLGDSLPDLITGDTLMTYLDQTLQTQAPAIAALMTETAIAWLTPEHDWHAGTLCIKTGLELLCHHS